MTILQIEIEDTSSRKRIATLSDRTLADGRSLRTPLWWYPKTSKASPMACAAIIELTRCIGRELDEDISVASMLRGEKLPARRTAALADGSSATIIMKLTPSWLKDHLETTAPLAEIVETLTRIGLEVEHVDDPGAKLKGFVVATVVEAKPHPNADRLRVCMVDTGAGAPVQVVCGAPNARTGMKSVFAAPGTYIPGKKITLTTGVIRGVESKGMLCSGAELELSNDHDGILDLPADAPIGTPYADYAGLEPVIDINLTPNRPDAAGIHGIARDLAAAGLGRLKQHEIKPVEGRFRSPVSVRLEFPESGKHLAPLFALRLVRGVKNGSSPEWLQKRLVAIGLRPINALVDITNYLTFDRGRPLHVFDAKKVAGNLVVRRAEAGEKLLALDGKTYALDESMVVIADDNGVESLAGIMGGERTGCDENTTDVLIESALWDPLNIAQTGRRLGIVSDARYRFERGVDPAFCIPGAELATHLVLDLCGGEPSELVVAGAPPVRDATIDFPWSEVKRLTGLALEPSAMAGILEKLGFVGLARAGNADRIFVKVPSWRPDVEGKADLVEEIVRIAGVDNVVATPLLREEPAVAKPILTLPQKRKTLARRALAASGLVEALTWSFISKDRAESVRRRQSSACARQSHRRRIVRYAAEPAAGPDRRRAAQCRPRPARRRFVRGRPDLSRGGRDGPAHERRRCPARHGQAWRCWPPLVGAGSARRRVRRQSRCSGAARRARRARAQFSDRCKRTCLGSSRPLGCVSIRPQEDNRAFRRSTSEGARSSRGRGTAGRRRNHSRRSSGAEGEADQG